MNDLHESINSDTHPKIYEALEYLGCELGKTHHSYYFIPGKWVPHLATIESALSGLSRQEFDDFVFGDSDQMIAIEDRSKECKLAGKFLNSYWEGWAIDP